MGDALADPVVHRHEGPAGAQTPLHGEESPKHDADEAPDAPGDQKPSDQKLGAPNPGDKAQAAPRAAAVNRH